MFSSTVILILPLTVKSLIEIVPRSTYDKSTTLVSGFLTKPNSIEMKFSVSTRTSLLSYFSFTILIVSVITVCSSLVCSSIVKFIFVVYSDGSSLSSFEPKLPNKFVKVSLPRKPLNKSPGST